MLDVDDVHPSTTTGEVRVVGGLGEFRVVAHVSTGCDEVGDGDFEGGRRLGRRRKGSPFGGGLVRSERSERTVCGKIEAVESGEERRGRKRTWSR